MPQSQFTKTPTMIDELKDLLESDNCDPISLLIRGFYLERSETREIYVDRKLGLCLKIDREKTQNTREWGIYNSIPDGSPYKEYFPKQHYLSNNSIFLLTDFIVHRISHETQWEKLKKEIKDNGFLNYCTYLIGLDPYELRKFDSWRFDVVDGKQKFKLVDFGS
jgi:hypothetical protein